MKMIFSNVATEPVRFCSELFVLLGIMDVVVGNLFGAYCR